MQSIEEVEAAGRDGMEDIKEDIHSHEEHRGTVHGGGGGQGCQGGHQGGHILTLNLFCKHSL